MGTSSSYSGPAPSGSLLPPWAPPAGVGDDSVPPAAPAEHGAPETGPTDTPLVPPSVHAAWPAAKSSLSRFATAGGAASIGGLRSLRSAARGFVRAQGGAHSAAAAARAGRSTAQSLGGFLASVVSSGAAASVTSYGLGEYLGRSADALLMGVLDRIAPDGAQLEEAAARAATVETLSELFAERGVEENGLAALETMRSEDIAVVMERFLVHYVYERMVQVLGRKLEDRDPAEVVRLERDIRSYIAATVHLDLEGVDAVHLDWSGHEARDLVERVFREAHSLLES